MASVSAFVSILEEFTSDIEKSFPEDEKIKNFSNIVEEKKQTPEGQKELLQMFNDGVKGDNAQLLTQKQSKFFKRSSFCRNLNLHNLSKTMSQQSRAAIWQYLNTMYVLNTTISNIPSELLKRENIMTELNQVKGLDAHPIFLWLNEKYNKSPKWNFYKYLFDRNGKLNSSWSSMTKPDNYKILSKIDNLL